MHTIDLPLEMPAPEVTPEQIERLVGVLSHASEHRSALPATGRRKIPAGWMTAAELASVMGDEISDPEVRAIASAACPVVVSYPGSPGYKLWQHCSIEEINHCIDAIESQATDMLKRSVMYRQAYHRRFRGEMPSKQPLQNGSTAA